MKRILSWSLAGFTWKANPKHARDLVAWAGLEQSKESSSTDAGYSCNDKDIEKRAGGTATHLAMDRLDIAHSIRRSN